MIIIINQAVLMCSAPLILNKRGYTNHIIYIDVIMIDFCKAFDIVPHKLRLNKLSFVGVCSHTLG